MKHTPKFLRSKRMLAGRKPFDPAGYITVCDHLFRDRSGEIHCVRTIKSTGQILSHSVGDCEVIPADRLPRGSFEDWLVRNRLALMPDGGFMPCWYGTSAGVTAGLERH